MIVLTTTTDLTIPVGGTINFDNVVLNTGCRCWHRSNSSIARIVGKGNFLISFHANIGSDTALTDAIVTVRDTGEPIPGMTLNSVTATGGDVYNVSGTTIIHNCCGDYGRISVANTGTTPINVGAGATLVIAGL